MEVTPILQLASARPYQLYSGATLYGTTMGYYVNPTTGLPVGTNSQRGTPLKLLDIAVTKYIIFGSSERKVALTAQFFDVGNATNFGNEYNGNALSVISRSRMPITQASDIHSRCSWVLVSRFDCGMHGEESLCGLSSKRSRNLLMADKVRYEVKDGVAVLTIDNPPVNVLSREVLGADRRGGASAASTDPVPTRSC